MTKEELIAEIKHLSPGEQEDLATSVITDLQPIELTPEEEQGLIEAMDEPEEALLDGPTVFAEIRRKLASRDPG